MEPNVIELGDVANAAPRLLQIDEMKGANLSCS